MKASKFIYIPCPSPKFVESFLADSIGLESHKSDNDVLFFLDGIAKYFNQLLKSGACTLSNAHIQAELDSKERALAGMVQMLTDTNKTSESAVQLALYKQHYMYVGLFALIVQYCFQTYTGYSTP